LNLPGSRQYDPSKPWVSKLRVSDNKVAADLFIYIDDGRVTGNGLQEADEAVRVATSRIQKLGIQDAPRKRRWGTRRPGAWAGSVVMAEDDGVCVTVTDEKWEKSQRFIGEILAELKASPDGRLDFKPLERKRGYLI
jgi:hypothetical protein